MPPSGIYLTPPFSPPWDDMIVNTKYKKEIEMRSLLEIYCLNFI